MRAIARYYEEVSAGSPPRAPRGSDPGRAMKRAAPWGWRGPTMWVGRLYGTPAELPIPEQEKAGATSTAPPQASRSIKRTSTIITSTAMTRLMGLFMTTSPLGQADKPQQLLPPGVQGPAAEVPIEGSGFYLPQSAPHLRHGTIQEPHAPEGGPVAARALVHHADDGPLLPPPGGYRRRRRGRPRRIFRLAGLQYGCSTRGPDVLLGLTFYLQMRG